jgi:hypothetical protein
MDRLTALQESDSVSLNIFQDLAIKVSHGTADSVGRHSKTFKF